MGRIGIISPIKKDYSGSLGQTTESSLALKGLSRIPGTKVSKLPYKELSGKYRTGLDENAAYIKRIQDPTERELEIKRIKELREKLEEALGVDLGPRSDYWNYAKANRDNEEQHVKLIQLMDKDNVFLLDDPHQELAFTWLKAHPSIASSLEAWERGEFPADTVFYVVDKDMENNVLYKRKKKINDAIVKLTSMTIDKKRKVARQLGLPVSDNTTEETVYNLIDNELKQTEFKSGKHQGLNPVEVFTRFADMKDNILAAKDLVKQALIFNIYREKPSGIITRGEAEVAKSEEELVKLLVDEDNQDMLIELENDIKSKKLLAV